MNESKLEEIKNLVHKLLKGESIPDIPQVGFIMVRIPKYISPKSFQQIIYSYIDYISFQGATVNKEFSEVFGQEAVEISWYKGIIWIVGVSKHSPLDNLLTHTDHINIIETERKQSDE